MAIEISELLRRSGAEERCLDFELTPDQDLLRATVRRFVGERARGHAVSRELMRALAELGLLGVTAEKELGHVELLLLLSELGAGSGGLGLAVLAHSIVVRVVDRAGGDLRFAWLERLAAGEVLGTTDALFPSLGRAGLSGPAPLAALADLWLVDQALVRGATTSESPLLGGDAAAFGVAALLQAERVANVAPAALEAELAFGVGAVALGVGEAALAAARRYALERRQFGQPIADFQAIQWKLADSATLLAAARWSLVAAALALDSERDAALAFQAKLLATDAALRAADEAIQIHGGLGYTRELPVERCYRDAKLLALAGGTDDELRARIAAFAVRAS